MEWKQFENVSINFHSKITILTGTNGAGKTTILNILSRHFGWGINELSSPVRDDTSGVFKFLGHLFGRKQLDNETEIGSISYDNTKSVRLLIPKNVSTATYQVSIPGIMTVSGLNIPSHRNLYHYTRVNNISTQKRSKKDAFELSKASYINKYNGGHGQSSNFILKETLLSWAVAGRGNEFIQPSPELIDYFTGFQDILKKVLPKSIGFLKISIRDYEIVLETKSGDFLLDAVSGGIASIIDLSWQIFNLTIDKSDGFVVLIDEIENHLHPSMQREILHSLSEAFPGTQFIITTHSPLVVSSVKDSNVYALKHNEKGRVISQKLDFRNEAKNANEILNDVLGIESTYPIWIENDFNQIIKEFSSNEINQYSIDKLKEKLHGIGMSKSFLSVINQGFNS